MATIASAIAAARSNRPASRRLLLLAPLLVALALSIRPGGAEADLAGSFTITSYNFLSNRLVFTYSTMAQHHANPCVGNEVYISTSTSTSTGISIGGSCTNTSDISRSITALNLGSGGSQTLYLRMGSGGGVNHLKSDTYTFPAKVSISSFSYNESTGIISATWTSPTISDSAADWHYVVTSSDGSEVASHGTLATDSPDTRSATTSPIEVPQSISVGQNLQFHVFADIGTYSGAADYQAVLDRKHYLSWSTAEPFTPTTLPQCSATDVVDLGSLDGFEFSLNGDLLNATCVVDAGVPASQGFGDTSSVGALIYSFQLAQSRTVTLTFTPVTPFAQATDGRYRVRVRRAGINGDVIGEDAGESNIEMEDLAIGALITYVVELMRYGSRGGQEWSLSISYGFIDPPTPTPLPTPTPRVQPNQDFRLHPNPSGLTYEVDTEYAFEFEGGSFLFPVSVRSDNPAALELSLASTIACDVTIPDELTVTDPAQVLHIRTCTAGKNTSLSVVSEGGGDLLADYNIYVRGGPVPTPMPAAPVPGAGAHVSKRDVLGLGILIAIPCGGLGIGCDIDLITNLLVTAVAVGVMAFLLKRSRGAATSMSVGVATVFAISVLMLGHLWLGFPLWIVGVALTSILAMGGLAMVVKGKQVG